MAITSACAKRWCTGADWADYIYCLVRSGPETERHRNLTFLLIPTDAPGITMQPIEHANLRYTASMDVFFDAVRVPETAIVGGPALWNQGWKLLTGRALDVEKIEITAVAYGIARTNLPCGFHENNPQGKPGGFEIAFVTDDVEAAWKRALDAGATAVSPPAPKPWGQIVAFVRDRDGIIIELCTPSVPS